MPTPVTDGKVAATASATSVTATFPASHTATAGNLLLAVHFVRDAGALTDPSGWTLVATQSHNGARRTSAWVKNAAGGETGLVGPTTVSTRQTLFVWEFPSSEVNTSDIITNATTVLTQAFSGNTSSVTSLAMTAIDPTASGDCYFICVTGTGGADGGGHTFTNSFTADLTDSSQATSQSTRNITNPGSTTTTHGWTTAQQVHGVLLAVPASSTSTIPPFRGFPRGVTRGARK